MIELLIILNICHWAADYTQLSRPYMLSAKALGWPLEPIFDHAVIHGVLMGVIAYLYTFSFKIAIVVYGLQTLSHFIIDVLKGRTCAHFQSLRDNKNLYHWWVFGIDQLLHQIVIIHIANYVLINR